MKVKENIKNYDGKYFYSLTGKRVNVLNHFFHVFKNLPRVRPWRNDSNFIKNILYNVSLSESKVKDESISYVVLGHATVLIEIADLRIITDPVWANRLGPLGLIGNPRKIKPPIKITEIPKIDLILLTHDHYDHMDIRALRFICEKYNPLIITGSGVAKKFTKKIISAANGIVELNWWNKHPFRNIVIHYVPAQHFSGRGIFFNRSLWGGFIIEAMNRRIWFAGDTGYDQELDVIYEKFAPLDLAFLPIGHYEPSYYLSEKHLSPHDAVFVHKKYEIKKSVAIHFGTYQLSLDDGLTQVKEFYKAIEKNNLEESEFSLPVFGRKEVFEI